MADRAPHPIWLYNNGMRGLQIPVPVVRDLKDHPNIAGIKAAGFDLMDIVPFCMMDGATDVVPAADAIRWIQDEL